MARSNTDTSKAYIEFLDGSKQPIVEARSTGARIHDQWSKFELQGLVPIGSRFIEVSIESDRFGGKGNDGYFDDLRLILNSVANNVKEKPPTNSQGDSSSGTAAARRTMKGADLIGISPHDEIASDIFKFFEEGSLWSGRRKSGPTGGVIKIEVFIDERKLDKFSGRMVNGGRDTYRIEGTIKKNKFSFSTVLKSGSSLKHSFSGEFINGIVEYEFSGITVRNKQIDLAEAGLS